MGVRGLVFFVLIFFGGIAQEVPAADGHQKSLPRTVAELLGPASRPTAPNPAPLKVVSVETLQKYQKERTLGANINLERFGPGWLNDSYIIFSNNASPEPFTIKGANEFCHSMGASLPSESQLKNLFAAIDKNPYPPSWDLPQDRSYWTSETKVHHRRHPDKRLMPAPKGSGRFGWVSADYFSDPVESPVAVKRKSNPKMSDDYESIDINRPDATRHFVICSTVYWPPASPRGFFSED